MRRRCQHVQDRLPRFIDDELPGWRTKLVRRHIERCDACAGELQRQRDVEAGLDEIGQAVTAGLDGPAPGDLLDNLLEQARAPGARGRVAGPMRGAVSGARPELSVALGLGIAALLAVAAWAGWRAGNAWSARKQ